MYHSLLLSGELNVSFSPLVRRVICIILSSCKESYMYHYSQKRYFTICIIFFSCHRLSLTPHLIAYSSYSCMSRPTKNMTTLRSYKKQLYGYHISGPMSGCLMFWSVEDVAHISSVGSAERDNVIVIYANIRHISQQHHSFFVSCTILNFVSNYIYKGLHFCLGEA